VETIHSEKKIDKSIITKHVLAAIRIHQFLKACPGGSILRLSVHISYWRKITFEHWNNVLEFLGKDKLLTSNWKDIVLAESEESDENAESEEFDENEIIIIS